MIEGATRLPRCEPIPDDVIGALTCGVDIGVMIGEVLDGLSRSNDGTNTAAEQAVAKRVNYRSEWPA